VMAYISVLSDALWAIVGNPGMSNTDFDVGVIGGGPAGSSMAAYLAKGGAKVVVFEREIMPRPHVGESLVPSSTRVLKELGFLPTMESAGFVRKYGAVWTAANAKGVAGIDFQGVPDELHPEQEAAIEFVERDQAGVDQPYTWHVDRGKFDL